MFLALLATGLIKYSNQLYAKLIIEKELLNHGDIVKVLSLHTDTYLTGLEVRSQMHLQNANLANDPEIIAISIYERQGGKTKQKLRLVNGPLLKDLSLTPQFVDRLRHLNNISWDGALSSEKSIYNSTVHGAPPFLTLVTGGPNLSIIVVDFKMDGIQKIFSSSKEFILFLVDREGNLIAHQNEKLALTGRNLNYLPIVSLAQEQNSASGNLIFSLEETHDKFVSTFEKIHWGATVMILQSQSRMLFGEKQLQSRLILLSAFLISTFGIVLLILCYQGLMPFRRLAQQLDSGHIDAQSDESTSPDYHLLKKSLSKYFQKQN